MVIEEIVVHDDGRDGARIVITAKQGLGLQQGHVHALALAKAPGMRNTLSIRRTVLSGNVSANSSARRTMRLASREGVWQAAKASKTIIPIHPIRFMPAKLEKNNISFVEIFLQKIVIQVLHRFQFFRNLAVLN